MSLLTPSEIKAKNKDSVVEYALLLQERIEALEASPLTDSAYKRQLLQMRQSIEQAKHKAIIDKEAYEAKVVEYNTTLTRNLKELELKYADAQTKDLDEVTKSFEDLESKVEESLAQTESVLKLAEADIKAREEELQRKEEDHAKRMQKMQDDLQTAVLNQENELQSEIDRVNKEHEREMEELKYNNTLELARNRKEFFNELANQQNMAVISVEELSRIKDYQAESEESVTKRIEEAVKEVGTKAETAKNIALNSLKSTKDNEISLLKKDVEHLTTALTEAKSTIKQYELRLADVPNQIREALASAKSDVTMVNEGKK